jgi:hypothetical protein
VTVVVIGIGLGAQGSMLVTPGQSLAVPTAIVAAVGGGIMLVAWLVASFRAGRQAGWIFAVGAAVVTVLACLWTFEFALPASIEWSDATAQAQAAFGRLQHSPENFHGTVPPQPCIVHATGSVGLLSAPYKGVRCVDTCGSRGDVHCKQPERIRRSRLQRPADPQLGLTISKTRDLIRACPHFE